MAPIAIFGGTFDPPHIGHLVLGECVAEQFACERVLFVPTGDPYRKTGTDTPENRRAPVAGRTVTSADLRLEMARLAVEGNPRFIADAREVARPGPTYTVDTLRELHAEGQAEIVLVLGTDAIAEMPKWREPGEIQRLARIVAAPKTPGADAGGFQPVDMPFLAVSSTLIRSRVAAGTSIRYLVPEPVRQLIAKHRLYKDLS